MQPDSAKESFVQTQPNGGGKHHGSNTTKSWPLYQPSLIPRRTFKIVDIDQGLSFLVRQPANVCHSHQHQSLRLVLTGNCEASIRQNSANVLDFVAPVPMTGLWPFSARFPRCD